MKDFKSPAIRVSAFPLAAWTICKEGIPSFKASYSWANFIPSGLSILTLPMLTYHNLIQINYVDFI